MSHIDQHLQANEQVLHRGHLNRAVFISPCLLLLLGFAVLALDGDVGVVLLLAGLVGLLSGFIRYKTSEFVVTNKRVILKTGLIRKTTVEIALNKVEGSTVDPGDCEKGF
ncbi:hypothetical protein GALL_177100 [mine drainage metagenome]|uniref:YdbS-like PH domain-containing protein n=1 Tax=mine drainage metagenome TaxID=410659 RepID=A0A1J5SEW0_9ZZZZ